VSNLNFLEPLFLNKPLKHFLGLLLSPFALTCSNFFHANVIKTNFSRFAASLILFGGVLTGIAVSIFAIKITDDWWSKQVEISKFPLLESRKRLK
jgi:RsiW-degrading membrane proteinase PrsW (M82 family)